ncbi:MAG: hypothetical protein ABIQ31_11975 [Ferruginibacter sp.]
MQKAIIQLTYRQVIDATSNSIFEKRVLHYSYEEYKMKSQAYNMDGNIATFTALKEKDGRANSLHYKSGFAIGGLIDGLKNNMPFLKDMLGQNVGFDTYKFELIESDITNMLLHKVAIHYITGWLTLYEIIGDTLLLSKENDLEASVHKPVETFMLKMQPGLSITSYQDIPVLRSEQ